MWHKTFSRTLLTILFMAFIFLYRPQTGNAQGPAVARFQIDEVAIIIAEDSPIPLWEGPNSTIIADIVRVGTVVRIDHRTANDSLHPYLVHSVTDHKRRGWVSGDVLIPVVEARNHIGNVMTCSHTPPQSPVCGAAIPVTPESAFTFHFDYIGVEPGDYLQWIIIVDGEQYSSRPVQLLQPNGARVLNLLDMDTLPHRFSGPWQVVIYINNESVHERNMTILSPHEFPQIEANGRRIYALKTATYIRSRS